MPFPDAKYPYDQRLAHKASALLAIAKQAADYANDTKDRFGVYFDGDDAESYDKLMDSIDAVVEESDWRAK